MVHQLWAKDDLYERSFHLGGSKPLRVEELEEKQGKALFQEKKAIGREERKDVVFLCFVLEKQDMSGSGEIELQRANG